MLTGKQKRFLRSQAHHLSPIFQVGKGGVNDAMTKQISEALEVRELIKISILQNCEDEKQEVAEALAKGARAELVQLIGLTVVLYKPSKNNKRIELPKASKA
ncbi:MULTISPECIES: ribosome assembly RNA-binding protein YhbY [Psychrobacillus]|uniref:Ribosome assembly RNA-binding protein YhbY n=1 Tax=Psychrobacillus faecigallinarum TaxID=2762235 RepID=A0ABR8R833_9BACI|nr:MULTISPECIES: ribosome assembly RNA-binding protein YhbY [Psychrobacillus]MBD7943805.1 ribosome assembly RNA-binding protein YhbY [Psychrobacillus faecigallinarum]QEY19317.1 ribosome assembly RNA-binding protein YhbY [Psychrobacillus sp. AK 1817]QGM29808.1 ribosome assembly RNA-binding protein YhbY [Bacillus sp. N3536]